MKKILFITGSRGEYGYIRPMIHLIKQSPLFEYEIVATNMHLLPEFGNTIDQFAQDGITVHYKIHNTLGSYNDITTIKSLALFLFQIPDIIQRSNPDYILIAGDRGEQFMAAFAGLHMKIPVAHIQAGELSGHIDGIVRHSITKLATIHLASHEEARQRVINMGENSDYVFNTGAPQIDDMLDIDRLDNNIKIKYGFKKQHLLFMLIYHPVHNENGTKNNLNIILDSIIEFITDRKNIDLLIILPNSDSNTNEIINTYNNIDKMIDNIIIVKNLERRDYLSFLKTCDLLIGNSSSGILEAATYQTPAINIGSRQQYRKANRNVIHVKKYNSTLLKDAINKCLSQEFKDSLTDIVNIYGHEKASQKILEILKQINITNLYKIKIMK